MARITARGIGFRHASRKDAVLESLSFAIDAGERVLLLGESGAGKSTLLMAIAGLLAEDEGTHSGSMQVDGTVGMVLQDPDSQVIASRVGDDVAFGCENLGMPRERIWEEVPRALEMVGLDLPLDHPTSRLSGGQKQRLALSGVIAMGADIILLDEPTANLDPEGVREVVAAVTRVAEETGATVIVVEHRVGVWSGFATRGIVLGGGGIVADGTLEEVLAQRGEELVAEGVWVPGIEPVFPPRPARALDNAAIEFSGLKVGWDTPLGPTRDGRILEGASTVITGRNGTGKTTLMLTLAGLLEPVAGKVSYSDSIAGEIGPDPMRWSSAELARRVGYVFQDPEHQFVARTVGEELAVGPRQLGIDAGEQIDALLARLRLKGLKEANPFTLSGGQKRRLSVATVLVASPKVVFLDEPTFGQDRGTFIELVTLVRELNASGVTVVSVTHDETYVRALGDEVIAL
ncbi:ABC transporter ATP-binding protein [Corynebacterium vitaeruminis DSM 20294]|uniref:ABC transporter ATP-binding protein n=1 Tax=Corynebacterium vitaeruminis DSM 20294 TaxID=1224164 RepID=W5Y7G3_9CORY|nr:ATP-binding cassette domain-containing protein [Corynebacterium vitaeruminis]AHI22423.1 ABC transporter ATP-binding protein [Corynebacterium vitaeruminis DSM 20294]